MKLPFTAYRFKKGFNISRKSCFTAPPRIPMRLTNRREYKSILLSWGPTTLWKIFIARWSKIFSEILSRYHWIEYMLISQSIPKILIPSLVGLHISCFCRPLKSSRPWFSQIRSFFHEYVDFTILNIFRIKFTSIH